MRQQNSKTKKVFLIFLVIASLATKGVAQNVLSPQEYREKKFEIRVKQLNEFVSRFNFNKSSQNYKFLKSVDKKLITRENFIISLFDYNYFKTNEEDVDCFVSEVLYDNIRLNFIDENWFAEANCRFFFQDTSVSIKLILETRKVNEQEFKWVITNVHSNFFKTLKEGVQLSKRPSIIKENTIISPVDNEINFMSLKRLLNNPKANFEKIFILEEDSLFFIDILRSGVIQFDTVEDLKYHFLQIPNWIFKVELFERKNLNTGWLIYGLSNSDNCSKEEYIKQILYN